LIAFVSAAVMGPILAGCEALDFAPLRDNPNDPGATVVAVPIFERGGR
jgi:hypothetical protein